ncbi:LOW QUALITY PROTEIN: hypothetical protein CVT26_008914 [Gymnopilus dilepis]|uniref:Uncharacterized protein n=1 Tax=Gymnopilus dilepis TaxID=231916 RepID=A0A409YRU1_9AGAR|nr:LOW QUALITY PROTEIN: hypothetical protein CVT26_008914 [Gymnopilus dilepis]
MHLKYKGVRDIVEKDDGRSLWLKFAQGVLQGLHQSEKLLGMVEALVVKVDRIQKGKSLHNMKYSEWISNFSNLLASTSTRAYETFRRHFGGRVMDNIDLFPINRLKDRESAGALPEGDATTRVIGGHSSAMKAELDRLASTLCAHNIDLAVAILKKNDYSGSLGLSWGDTESVKGCAYHHESFVWIHMTKLSPSFKMRVSNRRRRYALALSPLLLCGKPLCNAYQVRGTPHAANIHPASTASDGTEVARQTQDPMVASIPSHLEYHAIPNRRRAAARTFSASALDFQMQAYPDHRGLAVYLFVIGEHIDSWQNATSGMSLRGEATLSCIQITLSTNNSSLGNLLTSSLTLILVYRKHCPSYPLLPWLHFTEPCEHVFGLLRQIKKNFTFADGAVCRAEAASPSKHLVTCQQEKNNNNNKHHPAPSRASVIGVALFRRASSFGHSSSLTTLSTTRHVLHDDRISDALPPAPRPNNHLPHLAL